VLLASDAVHYYEESEKAMPFVSVADLVGMYAGFDTVGALAAGGQVISGHDPATLDRFGRDGGPLGDATAVIGRARA
jgi:hypothetical protein